MPTTELTCTAEGTDTSWFNVGGPNKWSSVASPDDEGTTKIQKGSANGKQNFIIDNLPLNAKVVDSTLATMRIRRYLGTQGNVNIYLEQGATEAHGTQRAATGSWATWTQAFVNDPVSGTPLTVSDVNSMELGVNAANMIAGSGVEVTTLYWDVTWTAFAGGFALMLSEWIPLLIGMGALTTRDLSLALSAMKTRPTYRWELEKCWLDLKNANRAYLFQGV